MEEGVGNSWDSILFAASGPFEAYGAVSQSPKLSNEVIGLR